MISWIPIAVNEKSILRGGIVLPEHSAAAIGSSVVLRVYGGGLGGVSISVTTIPFATSDDAANWIAEERTDIRYTSQLPEPAP